MRMMNNFGNETSLCILLFIDKCYMYVTLIEKKSIYFDNKKINFR